MMEATVMMEVLATDSYHLRWAWLMEMESVGLEEARHCAQRVADRVRLSGDPACAAEPYGDWWLCRVDCTRSDGMRFWLCVVFERIEGVCCILRGVFLERDDSPSGVRLEYEYCFER